MNAGAEIITVIEQAVLAVAIESAVKIFKIFTALFMYKNNISFIS
ncbi:hypothetical protein [Haemophilus influenzae]|nr:hypothetical protein [Haemophilus influenzae]